LIATAKGSPPAIADVDRRIDRQLAAVEAGVDAAVVGERIEALKRERAEAQAAMTRLEHDTREQARLDIEGACRSSTGSPTSAASW